MKKLILFSLILSFSILAQEKEDKYIMLKPLSWDELQLYQLDSLKTAQELKLAHACPTTLKKLQATHERTGQHFQHILGIMYIWSEYTNAEELKCFVKHDKIDTITAKEGKIINPNRYELLNTTQARVLKSASQGVGFKEKGIFEQARQANQHNQRIQNKPYEKYGGYLNLFKYMDNHKPTYQLDKELVKSLKHKDGNGSKQLPLYQLFELKYSEEQIQDLIEIVKKKNKKTKNRF